MQERFSEALLSLFESTYGSEAEKIIEWLQTPPSSTFLRFRPDFGTEEAVRCVQERLLGLEGRKYSVSTVHDVPDCLEIRSSGRQDVIPVEEELVVDARCGTAVLRGADVFVPGVMGMTKGCRIQQTVSVYADVAGKCRRGLAVKFDGERTFVGNGVLRVDRRDVFTASKSTGVAVRMTSPCWDCPSVGSLAPGKLFLQNLPSIVCGHVLGARPGEVVLDMCAAPGGKTTHVATTMANEGKLFALDKTQPKAERIKRLVESFDLDIVSVHAFDATKSVGDGERVPPFLPSSFDRILLDAPCSSLGQRPMLSNRADEKMLRSFPKIQRKLLEAAVQLLKPGGILVYSTCTLATAENEEMVAWTLRQFSNLSLVKAEPYLGGKGRIGCGLTEDQTTCVQRFDFNCAFDTIGFFIARFQKQDSNDTFCECTS